MAMARHVLANERHVRAMISIANSTESGAEMRPGFRFRLIEAVLEPMAGQFERGQLRRLELALAVIISAEACLTLKDVCKIDDDQIVEIAGWTASQLVKGFVANAGTGEDR